MFKKRLMALIVIFIVQGYFFYDSYDATPFKEKKLTNIFNGDRDKYPLDEDKYNYTSDEEDIDYSYYSDDNDFDIDDDGLYYMPFENGGDEKYMIVKDGYAFGIHYNPYGRSDLFYDEDGFSIITVSDYLRGGDSVTVYTYSADPYLYREVGKYKGDYKSALKLYNKILDDNYWTREELIRWVKDYVIKHRQEAIKYWKDNGEHYL